MTHIQKAVLALIKTHGSLRAAARAADIDPAYLMHLRDGTKATPGDRVLAALGIKRNITYTEVRKS